jgi:hypothetical protein
VKYSICVLTVDRIDSDDESALATGSCITKEPIIQSFWLWTNILWGNQVENNAFKL